jgi:hypothetical protein
MRYAPDLFFSDDIMPDAALPGDDIDMLFEQLQTIEPPPAVIARILELSRNSSSISIPWFSMPALRNPWEELDILAIHNDRRKPC